MEMIVHSADPGRGRKRGRAMTDITGQRFGRLTALHPLGRTDSRGSVLWLCRCDCGQELELSYNIIMYTNQKSCGCQRREHEQKLNTYLTHVAGTSVDMLRSKKIPTDNTTGCRGVYWIRGKYVAKIVFQKKAYYLGAFDDMEQAVHARREAEAVLFDGVADYYARWKQRAEADPRWGQENPMAITVEQKQDKTLDVRFYPEQV